MIEEALAEVTISLINEQQPVRTQFMIFTLFGDYIIQRGGKVWTSHLLDLMERLGISERAVRSTLSRMTQKRWLVSHKQGRRSQYSLTPEGQVLFRLGDQRIFEPIFTDWDNQWYLVVYSLPEEKRRIRHALRTQLTWLGFGSLAPGTWISPHRRRVELQAAFEELDVESYVDLFCGPYLGPAAAQELVQRCWDLDGLAVQYRDFITRYQPAYEECLASSANGMSLTPEECFVRRFWLMHEYQSFPLRDPNLPTVLLPADWEGLKARQLFDDYRRLLGTHAHRFIDDIMLEGT
jgi:phenylacetic acid degradation operon negative regulatory protein